MRIVSGGASPVTFDGTLDATFTVSTPPAGIVSGSVIPAGSDRTNIVASGPLMGRLPIDSGAVPVLRMTSLSGGLARPPRGSLKNIFVCSTLMFAPGGIGRRSVMRRAPVSFSSYSET